MKTHFLIFLIIILSLISSVSLADSPIDIKQDNVIRFIDEMVKDHKFDRQYLREILSKAKRKESIIKLISAPAERTLNWSDYRKIFITDERIMTGVNFWKNNKEMLERIESESGVRSNNINDIKVLDSFSFVEVSFGDAENIIESFRKGRGRSIVSKAKDKRKFNSK